MIHLTGLAHHWEIAQQKEIARKKEIARQIKLKQEELLAKNMKIVIVLLGLVVSNVGAIYRMRQGLFIPYFIIGVYGLNMLFTRVRNFLSRHEYRNPV